MSSNGNIEQGFVDLQRQAPTQTLFGLGRLQDSQSEPAALPTAPMSDSEGATRARREVESGDTLYRQQNHRGASVHYAHAVALRPNEPAYHVKFASALWMAGELDRAEHHLRQALSLDPNNPAIHEKLAWWYVQQGRLADALRHSGAAIALAPERISYKVTHADVLWAEGQFDAAWDLIRPLAEAGVGGHWLARVFANMAGRFGKEHEALAAIERELPTPGLSPIDRAGLHYAAISLLDSLGQFDAAFAHARRVKALVGRSYDPQIISRSVSDRIAYFTERQLASLPRATRDSSRTLLIVGMPRSGTSLVEQILASHRQVFGAGELTWLYDAGCDARQDWTLGEPFPFCWNNLAASRANQLASRYLDRIEALNSTAAYVTDKMPTNFHLLGAAQLLLPQCKVIHCVRDPRDTCLSCYFNDFAAGNDYTFHLSHLAQYYRDYVRLMDHWKKVLSIPILDVRYEELVANPADGVRRMLEFLDLPWDEQCLKHHQNKRHIATASRDQVRRPIYASSVGRWKHYEKYIPELMALVEG